VSRDDEPHEAAEAWFEQSDREGAAFEYDVIEE
jgi:hypothetical protein